MANTISDRKHDATGRSTNVERGRKGKLRRPPSGESWCWVTKDLLKSDAWQGMSINCRRFLDALLVEDMAHAGTENGNLICTFDQLVALGIRRNAISKAKGEAIARGLVRETKKGGRYGFCKEPSRYRLTWYSSHDGSPATNDWKGVTKERLLERE